FDQPFSLMTSVYYRDQIMGIDEQDYTEGRVGTRISLGHQFSKEIGGTVGIRIEDVDINSINPNGPPDYFAAHGHNTIIAPGLTLFWDRRDSFMRPTEGGKIEFQYEQVFGTASFPLLNLEGTHYFTLWQRPDGSGKHVLALRSQVSFAGTNT